MARASRASKAELSADRGRARHRSDPRAMRAARPRESRWPWRPEAVSRSRPPTSDRCDRGAPRAHADAEARVARGSLARGGREAGGRRTGGERAPLDRARAGRPAALAYLRSGQSVGARHPIACSASTRRPIVAPAASPVQRTCTLVFKPRDAPCEARQTPVSTPAERNTCPPVPRAARRYEGSEARGGDVHARSPTQSPAQAPTQAPTQCSACRPGPSSWRTT